MSEHEPVEGSPLEVRSRPSGRPDAYFHGCTCGFTGPERERQSQCLIDQDKHEREMREAAA